jgi:sugar phosphate isomerase/epimerase
MNNTRSLVILLVIAITSALLSCRKDRSSGQESASADQPAEEQLASSGTTDIGLQLYSLRHEFEKDVPGTLAKIREMGFREVEGGGTYGYSMDEFKAMLAQNGLSVVSVGAGYEDLVDNPQSVVDNAKAFGAKFVMCAWIPHPGDTFTIEHVKQAAADFNSAGKLMQENGISFNYHIHGYEFRPHEDGTLFDYLVENTDPRYVNFELDVFWSKQGGQDPVALMKKYPQRFTMLHLKDRKHGTPDTIDGRAPDETNVVLGTGDVNIAEVMKTARAIGVRYYFIEDESPDALEQIPLSLEYLRGI